MQQKPIVKTKGIKDILIRPDIAIKQAMRLMDNAQKKILLVVNNENMLLGVVNDGDIRRWILKENSLESNVSEAMNKKPIFLKTGYSEDEAKETMLSTGVDCIPILDENKKVVSAVWWIDFFKGDSRKKRRIDAPVIIMAGGEGKRLLPFTNVLPKPLIPIGESTIIELIINKFRDHGANDFYLSLNYKSNLIKAYFNDFEHDYNIHFIAEEEPLGTAGSLRLLKSKLKSTFFICNCDTLIEADYADILDFHKESKNKITIVGSMKHYKVPYGVCEIENGGYLRSIQEKPEHDHLVITGLYVLEPETLVDIPDNKLYHMTNLINMYTNRGERVGVYPVSEKSWLDTGHLEELQELLKKFNTKKLTPVIKNDGN